MSDPVQRRRSVRHRFSCRARFRNAQELQSDLERLCVTRDFSRDGVYFITDDPGLREHTKLLLRFPENLPDVQDRDYLVEVMRINALPQNRRGVAARLILRTIVGRCADVVVSTADISRYGVYVCSRPLIDLYA